MLGEIRNQQGERLDYTFHSGAPDSKWIIVLGHGVTGNKDRPFIVALAEALAAAGIPALRVSYAGNGASEGKFTDCTITKEVADLGAVFDNLGKYQVGYIGHSMGGVGVLRASQDQRIQLLVSLAGMVHTRAFAEREFGSVKPGAGFMWDEPSCPLSQAYMDDMNRIDTVVKLGAKVRVPWLLVHGTEDDVVPIKDSHEIFAVAQQPKKLVEIRGANHVFAGEFTSVLIDTVVEWVKGHVRK
jgi:uncharacterized protein